MSVSVQAVDRVTDISNYIQDLVDTEHDVDWIYLEPFQPGHRTLTQHTIVENLHDHWHLLARKKVKDVSIEKVIEHYFDTEFVPTFKRFCKISRSDFRDSQSVYGFESVSRCLVMDMLLRMSVFRQLPESVRSQNNVSNLFFFVAREVIHSINTSEPESEYEVTQRLEYKHLFNEECRFIYDLMRRVGFRGNVQLLHLFTKDDLNSNCVTPPFVRTFLNKAIGDVPFEYRFEAAFMEQRFKRISHDPYMIELMRRVKEQVATGKNQIPQFKESVEQGDEELRRRFIRYWKTFNDQFGIIFGYITFFSNYSVATIVQLFVLSVSLFLSKDGFYKLEMLNNMLFISLCCVPIGLSIFFVFFGILGKLFTIPWTHVHLFSLTRRDAHVPLSMSWKNLPSNILNMVLWVLVYCLQWVVLKWMLFPDLENATNSVIYFKGNYATVDFIIAFAGLLLAWSPVLLISLTITPIVYAVIICSYAAFGEYCDYCRVELFADRYTPTSVWQKYSNFNLQGLWSCFTLATFGIHTEHHYKRRMRDERTIRFFAEKMLNTEYPEDNDKKRMHVKIQFAKVYNYIIQDFFNDCLISDRERQLMQFYIPANTSFDTWFVRGIVRITKIHVKSKVVRYQLTRFLSYLWNPRVPTGITVENMKAVRITIPVYNETIIESFKAITDIENSNTSYLEHVIRKYPNEWDNFINQEKYSSVQRDKLVRLEEAIKGKQYDIENSLLLKEEDKSLRMDIRVWASNKFQYVCRCIIGAAKIYDSLKILAICQMGIHESDRSRLQEVDKLIKRKFRVTIGTQVYSKRENYPQYCDDVDYLFTRCGDKGVQFAYQRIVGDKALGVLRTKCLDPKSEEFIVESYGDFLLGQGKPCHQSFLLQFFDGSIIEAIDCNQDMNASQGFFVPNILEEFSKDRRIKVVGFKEYVTTMDWSAAGYGAGYTEKVFGSILQRSWTSLGVRLHYGHPDFIRGTCVLYETGMSSLDYISEDVFFGMDVVLQGGIITYADYYEVGKARDVCIDTTSAFMSKIAGGARHVGNSRQVQQLMTPLMYNPFKQLSIYQTTIGHYFTAVLVVFSCYMLSIIRIIIAIMSIVMTYYGVQKVSFDYIYAQADSYFWVQLGVALSVPGFFQSLIDTGIAGFVGYIVYLKFLLQTIFSAFHLLNTAYYFHASFTNIPLYLASGRTPGLKHKDVKSIFTRYYKTHFRTCFHLIIMLFIILGLRLSWQAFLVNGVLIAIWMWSPFVFNRGSFSSTVGNKTWKILNNENWKFVHDFGIRRLMRNNNLKQAEEEILKKEQLEIMPTSPTIYQTKKLPTKMKCTQCIGLTIDWFIDRVKAINYVVTIVYSFFFNYIFVAVILTGIHYANLIMNILPLLIPFYALKPYDEYHSMHGRNLLHITIAELTKSGGLSEEELRLQREIQEINQEVRTIIQKDAFEPPEAPPVPNQEDLIRVQKQMRAKQMKDMNIPPQILPILSVKIGERSLQQGLTMRDIQDQMSEVTLREMNIDYHAIYTLLETHYARYDDLVNARNFLEESEETGAVMWPSLDAMIRDFKTLKKKLPRMVDLEKLSNIVKLTDMIEWTFKEAQQVEKMVNFFRKVEQADKMHKTMYQIKQEVVRIETVINQYEESLKSILNDNVDNNDDSIDVALKEKKGTKTNMTTTMDNMVGSIMTAYKHIINAYTNMTHNNVPTLEVLQDYFGNAFTIWNTQWREDVAILQFRLARSFLRSGIILHMLFEDWYATSVMRRKKPMNEMQLRNARIRCEKVVHHFTQCQVMFTKGKDTFGMNFIKMNIKVPQSILAQVDFNIVENMKRRFASIGFCALVELWLEHNEQLSMQYRYLIMNLTEEVAPIMLSGRDLLHKRIEECVILFETDQEEYQHDLQNLETMATPRTPNPTMIGVFSPSSPVTHGPSLVVPGISPSNRKVSSRKSFDSGNVVLKIPSVSDIRVELPYKGEGVSIELPPNIESPATGPASSPDISDGSPVKQNNIRTPERLGFRQLLVKNAQKKGKLRDIELHDIEGDGKPKISTRKKKPADVGMHFDLSGGLTPQSESTTKLPLPPLPGIHLDGHGKLTPHSESSTHIPLPLVPRQEISPVTHNLLQQRRNMQNK